MEKDKTFEIDLVQLKEGKIYEHDYHIGRSFFEDTENHDVSDSDVDVHLQIEKRHDAYVLEFDFAGTLYVPCDRCLEAVSVPVDEIYDLMVRHGEEYDDSHDDLLIIPENQTRLDVAPMIYDTLLLAIPLRCVHPDGECNSEMQQALENISKDN